MPYSPSEVSRSIATEVVALTIAFAKRWIKATDPWGIVGMLTKDGVGYAGQPIYVQIYDVGTGTWGDLGGGPYTTGSDGRWSIPVTSLPGHAWGCRDLRIRARYGTYYSVEGMLAIAFPTRISITTPDKVEPGKSFTITGKLEYEISTGSWQPLSKYINIYKDAVYLASILTDASGVYTYTTSISTSATFKVIWEPVMPTALFFTPAFAELPILNDIVTSLLVAVPVIATGAVLAWDALRRK